MLDMYSIFILGLFILLEKKIERGNGTVGYHATVQQYFKIVHGVTMVHLNDVTMVTLI